MALPPGAGDPPMVNVHLKMIDAGQAIQRGYIVLAPQILGLRFKKEGRLIVPALFKWMDRQLSYDREHVALIGQSNGGLGAFYAAIAEPKRFQSIIVCPGGYDGPSKDLAKLKGKYIWFVVGEKDEPLRQWAEKNSKILKKANAKVKQDVLPGQGHILQFDPRQFYDWLDWVNKQK